MAPAPKNRPQAIAVFRAKPMHFQKLSESDDRVEGRSQLVVHRGEKLAAGGMRLVRRVVRVFEGGFELRDPRFEPTLLLGECPTFGAGPSRGRQRGRQRPLIAVTDTASGRCGNRAAPRAPRQTLAKTARPQARNSRDCRRMTRVPTDQLVGSTD